MKKPTITQIENAFQPAKEVDTAERFAGRKQYVAEAHYALIARGAHIAIVGNRGIGKTSLANQIFNLSSGDYALLDRLGINHDKGLNYLPIYFACGTNIENTTQLLSSILTLKTCLADWIYDIPKASKFLKGITPKVGANLLGLEVGIGADVRSENTSEAAVSTHSIEAVFLNVVRAIIDEEHLGIDGILIIVDEFDQIGDPSGFASFLKSIATNAADVKFCIVGVAQDIQKLMKEHESADRLFAGSIINLPSMSPDELTEIIRIAEASIDRFITFTESGVARLVHYAQGHPYMIHLIGKYAIRAAFQTGAKTIQAEDIDFTVVSIAERAADPVLEGRYRKAVGSSDQRETVLKAMVEVLDTSGEISTTRAYALCNDRGVENPSQYVGQLGLDEYGGVLQRVRERYYRFSDSLFAAYVKARPRLVVAIAE